MFFCFREIQRDIVIIMRYRQDCKEIGDRGGTLAPPPLFGAKKNFPCKIGKHKVFTCEERVRLCFIY